jgi:hypothetical protein
MDGVELDILVYFACWIAGTGLAILVAITFLILREWW